MSKRYISIAVIAVIVGTGFFFFTKLRVNPITRTINPRAYGSLCSEIVSTCNGLTVINCKSEVDGPLYYVNSKTGTVVAKCGGVCDRAGGCQTGTCPPKEWTCESATNQPVNVTANTNVIPESYLACGCGCCGGVEPQSRCLYHSKGDDLAKIIAQDKEAAKGSICESVGCSIGIQYRYCD